MLLLRLELATPSRSPLHRIFLSTCLHPNIDFAEEQAAEQEVLSWIYPADTEHAWLRRTWHSAQQGLPRATLAVEVASLGLCYEDTRGSHEASDSQHQLESKAWKLEGSWFTDSAEFKVIRHCRQLNCGR